VRASLSPLRGFLNFYFGSSDAALKDRSSTVVTSGLKPHSARLGQNLFGQVCGHPSISC
jgi:hypothetical protein